MKKCITIISGLVLGLSAMGQTYLAHKNDYKSAFFQGKYSTVSAFDLHENFLYINDGDTIHQVDLLSGSNLNDFVKPGTDTVSLYASFLTVSPDGKSVWAGYTSNGNMDDRIYCIDLESGEWKLKARFPGNFDLAIWNDSILVSGLNSLIWGDPNAIFLLDTSGLDQHRMLIKTGGNSAGMALDSMGNIYFGTSSFVEQNGIYRWDSMQLAEVLDPTIPDTLALSDAMKITDVPAGVNDCDIDEAGNLVFNMNLFGGEKVLAIWNGTPGDGQNLDTLAIAGGEWDWLGTVETMGDVTLAEEGNSIITFSFGNPLVDVHTADYRPFVANPLPDLDEQEFDLSVPIDLSLLFSDPDDPDSMIVMEVLYDMFPLEVRIDDNKLYIYILQLVKGAAEYMETEVVIQGISAGLAVTDTFIVAIDYVGGIGEHEQSGLDVYPNPSSGIYRVKGAEPGVASVAVFTLTGTEVFRRAIQVQDEPVDITDLPNGTYILRITGDRGESSTLIHKQ